MYCFIRSSNISCTFRILLISYFVKNGILTHKQIYFDLLVRNSYGIPLETFIIAFFTLSFISLFQIQLSSLSYCNSTPLWNILQNSSKIFFTYAYFGNNIYMMCLGNYYFCLLVMHRTGSKTRQVHLSW